MYLSLPLPESKVRQLTAILLHADGAAPPREYGLEVPQTGAAAQSFADLLCCSQLVHACFCSAAVPKRF
jgi:hypothetical protein